MIAATRNEGRERFVIADGLAAQLKRDVVFGRRTDVLECASAENAGLHVMLDESAVSVLSVADFDISGCLPTLEKIVEQKRPNFQPYAGEWVVISRGRVIEHGTNLSELVERARRRGELKPYVIFVEKLEEGTALISL